MLESWKKRENDQVQAPDNYLLFSFTLFDEDGTAQKLGIVPLGTQRQTYRQTETLQYPRILISSHGDCPILVKKRVSHFFNLTLSGLLRELESMRFPPWKLDMDPRDHHDPELEALERALALDRTEPVDRTDRLERLLEADMDEMPARNECEFSVESSTSLITLRALSHGLMVD